MRRIVRAVVEALLTFHRGAPCDRHPSHRTAEFDPFFDTWHEDQIHACSECWREFEANKARVRNTD